MAAAPAAAHNSHGWYWGAGAANRALEARYDDILDADCTGFGRWMWTHGVYPRYKMYRHFDCFDELLDGTSEEVILHVKGHFAFSVFYISE